MPPSQVDSDFGGYNLSPGAMANDLARRPHCHAAFRLPDNIWVWSRLGGLTLERWESLFECPPLSVVTIERASNLEQALQAQQGVTPGNTKKNICFVFLYQFFY